MNKINIKELAKKHGTTFSFSQPEKIVDANYIKELRTKLNFTQLYFAQVLGVTKKTIEKWEQGKNPAKGTAAALLFIIKENPEILKLLVRDSTNYSVAQTSIVEEKPQNEYVVVTSIQNKNKNGGNAQSIVFCAA